MNSAMFAVVAAFLMGIGVAHADDYGADSGDDTKTPNQLVAEAAMARGNWAAAAPLLEAHIAGHSDDDEAIAELGNVYAHLGH